MSEWQVVSLIIAGFLVGFPILWCGIVLLISWVGGWSRLARKYPGGERPDGEAFRWCSLNPSVLVNYRNSIHVTLSEAGVYLEAMILFRFGHAPILIPWEDIASVAPGGTISSTMNIRVEKAGKKVATIACYRRPLAEALPRWFAKMRGS